MNKSSQLKEMWYYSFFMVKINNFNKRPSQIAALTWPLYFDLIEIGFAFQLCKATAHSQILFSISRSNNYFIMNVRFITHLRFMLQRLSWHMAKK